MKRLSILALLLFAFSCGKEQGNLTVNANIKGLKKGTVYLQKVNDSLLTTVDSLTINGNENFELHGQVNSPEIFYLTLKKHDKSYERIPFFAEQGLISINSTLKNYVLDAEITGSENQDMLDDYRKVISQMNNKRLDLIKEEFEASKLNDTAKLSEIRMTNNHLTKRKYLYTVNFAVNHNNLEVAPYLALTEIYDANVKWLDTINGSLSPKVKESLYGKQLEAYIAEIKK